MLQRVFILLILIWGSVACSPTNDVKFQATSKSVVDDDSTNKDVEFEKFLTEFEADASKTMAQTDCPEIIQHTLSSVKAEKIECGALRVNDSALPSIKEQKSFSLGYMYIQDTEHREKPLLVISQGGPGGSSMELLAFYVSEAPELLQNFHVLAVEHRGTRWSRPNILCRSGNLVEEVNVGDCIKDFDSIVNLSSIHSYEIANDIVNSAKRFGYRAFSFLGVSYGAHIGQMLLQHFPEYLERVVLDSPTVPYLDWKMDAAQNSDLFLQYFLGSCSGEDCVSGFSHKVLFEKIQSISKSLINEPMKLTFTQADGQLVNGLMSNEDFVNLLFVVGYVFSDLERNESLMLMEDFVDVVEMQDTETLTTLLSILGEAYEGDHTNLMFNAITCREFPTVPQQIDLSKFPTFRKLLAYDDAEKEESFIKSTFASISDCHLFSNLKSHPKTLLGPVDSNHVVLVVGAEYDHVTHPKYVDLTTEHMPNAKKVVFADAAHGVFAQKECINKSIIEYLSSENASFKNYCQ